MDSLEKLKEQTRFFLREAGHCGWPWLRMYLRCFITKALEKHSMEEVNAAIKEAVAETAKELNADPEKWLA